MLFSVPQGQFKLNRTSSRTRGTLQAWDAADEYLLYRIAEEMVPEPGNRVLIVNDSFGALAVALSILQPSVMSDSWLSHQATLYNLSQNGLAKSSINLLNCLDPLPMSYQLVLIKVPKTLSLLEYQLIRIKPHLTADAKVLLAGMVKHLPPSVGTLIERILGPSKPSLTRKKARLITVITNSDRTLIDNPYPCCYRLEQTNYRIANHANVFSREKLDIGTRFFLQHVPSSPKFHDIIDLGCGNGVVGLIAAERNPWATLHFIDESYMAIASARENFYRAFGTERKATFTSGDALRGVVSGSADLILCNPPFHNQHAIEEETAREMIRQSKMTLRPLGELWLIGNRHLRYDRAVDQWFGNQTVVASNSKFVIIKAVNINKFR